MHLTGIILDLRNCSGGNAQDAQDVFSLLSFDAKHKAVLNDPVPILVLTDSETAGPAEILAKLLEHTRYGLCIGEKTKGTPFPRKKIHSGKLVLYVPLIPEELGTLTPDALTPAIRTAVKPRMKYRDLSENKPVTENRTHPSTGQGTFFSVLTHSIKNGENKQYENKAPRPPDANCPESSAVSSSRPQQLQSAL